MRTCMLEAHSESNKPKIDPHVQPILEEERLTQIQAQIDRLLAERSILDLVREVLLKTQSLFPINMSTTIPLYDRKMDPVAHVQTYRTWMAIAKTDATTLCNVFPLTLSRPTQAWFGRLHARTISNFE